jgi:hypothetical protein
MSIQRLSNAGQSGYRYKTLIAGITPVASVPVIGEATALTFSTASVTFTAPGAYAATTFTATSSPGGLTGTSATSPITVSGLSEQTAYTFTVTATNATGTSGPSAATSSITTPTAFEPAGAYDLLSTTTVSSGGAASVTFQGIPGTYKHLQIRHISLSNTTAGDVRFQANSDSAGNYSLHQLYTDGGANPTGSASSNATYIPLGVSGSTTVPGLGIADILDYTDVSKFKTVKTLHGLNISGGTSYIFYDSGNWRSLNPITSITLFINGVSFNQHSSFALYGVK